MATRNEKGEWKTIKGVHVFIRDGESIMNALNRQIAKDNEDKKQVQIAKNSKQAILSSGKSKEYTRTQKDKMITKFEKDTGLSVELDDIDAIPGETLEMSLRTIQNHLSKYGRQNFEIHTVVISRDLFDQWDANDALAGMVPSGELHLNPEYFEKPVKYLDADYQEGYEKGKYPKGNAESIIIHELGHARFNKNTLLRLFAKYDKYFDFSKFGDLYNLCLDSKCFSAIDSKLIDSNRAYKDLVDILLDFQQTLDQNDLDLRNMPTNALNTIHELVATSYQDVIDNKDKANKISKIVVRDLLGGL